ncbi:MAG: hypothetical protein KatS3mg076_1573 [Candidatus Binatia bacterium]|nr:MAG: hypothetical protein KatS3mg076_1573 [Candidatus Binatia bacterium]
MVPVHEARHVEKHEVDDGGGPPERRGCDGEVGCGSHDGREKYECEAVPRGREQDHEKVEVEKVGPERPGEKECGGDPGGVRNQNCRPPVGTVERPGREAPESDVRGKGHEQQRHHHGRNAATVAHEDEGGRRSHERVAQKRNGVAGRIPRGLRLARFPALRLAPPSGLQCGPHGFWLSRGAWAQARTVPRAAIPTPWQELRAAGLLGCRAFSARSGDVEKERARRLVRRGSREVARGRRRRAGRRRRGLPSRTGSVRPSTRARAWPRHRPPRSARRSSCPPEPRAQE